LARSSSSVSFTFGAIMSVVPPNKRPFIAGLVLGAVFGAALNIAPLVPTRQMFRLEPFEGIGFPFVFHRFGGYTGMGEFTTWAFAADFLFVVLLATGLAFGLRSYCGGHQP
jgi:hypothetical protein